ASSAARTARLCERSPFARSRLSAVDTQASDRLFLGVSRAAAYLTVWTTKSCDGLRSVVTTATISGLIGTNCVAGLASRWHKSASSVILGGSSQNIAGVRTGDPAILPDPRSRQQHSRNALGRSFCVADLRVIDDHRRIEKHQNRNKTRSDSPTI